MGNIIWSTYKYMNLALGDIANRIIVTNSLTSSWVCIWKANWNWWKCRKYWLNNIIAWSWNCNACCCGYYIRTCITSESIRTIAFEVVFIDRCTNSLVHTGCSRTWIRVYLTIGSSKVLQAVAFITIDKIWNQTWNLWTVLIVGPWISRPVVWIGIVRPVLRIFDPVRTSLLGTVRTCAIGAIETRIRVAFVF